MGYTRDKQAAEDLVQDTLLKALSNKDRFALDTNVRGWLFTIMRNIFINTLRRKRVVSGVMRDASGHSSEKYFFNSPESDSLDSYIMARELQVEISRLPNTYKIPMSLFVEGFKYIEIAEIIEQPLGTVKSRIHFARRFLKKQAADLRANGTVEMQ